MLFVALWGCSGEAPDAVDAPVAPLVDASLLAAAWQIEAAPLDVMGALTSDRGWRAFYSRDYDAALAAGSSDTLAARVHAERFALYRQASLLQANAIRATYGADQRREGDPAEVDYLLAVAAVVHGDLDEARALLSSSRDGWAPEVSEAAAAWDARLAQEAVVLDAISLPMPEDVAPWSLAETVGELSVQVVDPTAVLALGAAEYRAAMALGGVEAVMAPWTLALDPATTSAAELGLHARFLSAWPSAGDAVFAAAARQGSSAVAAHAGTSLLAAAIAPCVEGGFDLVCIGEASAGLSHQIEAAMTEAAGEEQRDHRDLANLARVGVLRAAARLAEADGERETSGRLMVEALDRSLGPAADPTFFMSLAAWDAQNRNAVRAQELVHPLTERFEGVAWARSSLDALHLRVSRDAGPGLPMH